MASMNPERQASIEALENEPQEEIKEVNKNKKYRREKPWDTDDIDHWKIEEFKAPPDAQPFLEESSFATLFPKYRETYLREIWPLLTTALKAHGLICVLDLIEGSMTVKTTRKTVDPYIVLKGRDLLKLLARSVPFPQAVRILEDGIACDIVKIGNIVRNKERFVKRRQRLLGPNGNTLKAIELLTQCYVLVQGNTVSTMGPFKGLKQVRNIVIDCMNNIHPIYHIKELMIKRELAKDEKLKNESWDRFLPHFKKRSVRAPKKNKGLEADKKAKKKEYTPFPPAQTPRKVDLQIESGEFFLSQSERDAAKLAKKKEDQAAAVAQKQVEKEKDFVAPKESILPRRSKVKADTETASASIDSLKEKFKKLGKRKQDAASSETVQDYIIDTTGSLEVEPKKKIKKSKKAKREDE